MEKQICPKCGRKYLRTNCEYCYREATWDEENYYTHFPKRIRKLLPKIEVNISAGIENFRNGMGSFISGPVGCGKTVFACKLMLEIIKISYIEKDKNLPRTFQFIELSELFRNIQRFIETPIIDGQNVFTYLDEFREIDCLVLDDIGLIKLTDWTFMRLYEVLNHRYNQEKLTIYTSNFNIIELSKFYDDRLLSRIAGSTSPITFTNKDRRLNEKAKK